MRYATNDGPLSVRRAIDIFGLSLDSQTMILEMVEGTNLLHLPNIS